LGHLLVLLLHFNLLVDRGLLSRLRWHLVVCINLSLVDGLVIFICI